VVSPTRSAELALPVNLPLVDLIPSLVGHFDDLTDEMVGRGVVLQRLGGEPLDDDRTPAVHGLRDGETVYLRPREAPIPGLKFDDLIDGVAVRVSKRPGRWSPEMTRRLLLGLAAAALGLGLGVLLVDGPHHIRAVAAGVLAIVLLLAAVAASRAFGDRPSSVLLALGAIGYAAVGGLLVPGLPSPGTSLAAAALLGSAAAAAAAAAVAWFAIADRGPLFLGTVLVSTGSSAGALLVLVTPLDAAQAAAVVVALVLLLSPVVPSAAFRLAGARLPDVPASVEDIGREVDPVPEDVMVVRTAAADRYVTAMYVTVGALCGGALVWLAPRPGWVAVLFTVAVCALLGLRSRVLENAWQRFAMVVPAVFGGAGLLLRWAMDLAPPTRIGFLLVSLVVAGLSFLAAARVMPDRRLRPYWGRAAEFAESLLAVALLPLMLGVLGVYGLVRGLGG
jgi:type VII secretion integral membrane protein EccD